MNISEQLWTLRDEKYADFQCGLIPTVSPESIIGVRTPILRKMAKQMAVDEAKDFIAVLPHAFFEENQLHAFLISLIKDYSTCMAEVERFLPFVDNWATCDQLSPKCFTKNKADLLGRVDSWMSSDHEYTVRFAICTLMRYFLDDDFDAAYLEKVSSIDRQEYYIRMMQAWFFATAMAKQYDATLPYIEQRKLQQWTHNKAIQKAVESFRVSDAQKSYLKTLRWK